MISGLVRRLASPRIAAYTMLAGALLVVIAFLVPQRTFLAPGAIEEIRREQPGLVRILEITGLDTIYGGWPTFLLAGVLVVNVSACTWRRVGSRRHVVTRSTPAPAAFELACRPDRTAAVLGEVTDRTRSSGWTVVSDQPASLALRRGSIGFAGSIVMHLSLIVLIVGAAVTAATSFRAYAVLSEGESVLDARDSYLSVTTGSLTADAYSGARIALGGVAARYGAEGLESGSAVLTVTSASGAESATVRVNHPFDVAGRTLYLEQLGLSADLEVASSAATREVTVALGNRTGERWSDSVDLGAGAPTRLELRGSPSETGRPLEVAAPRLRITDAGASRELAPGESATLQDGTRVRFLGARHWGRILVRSESGRLVVYLAFWLILAGSALRFAFPDERLTVTGGHREGGYVVIVGYSARPWPPPGRLDRVRGMIEAAIDERGGLDDRA